MTTLEACYELDFSKIEFLERKARITHPKTLLLGPPKSGKSYLIYDYLSNFDVEEYLYIDFHDFKNSKKEIVQNLTSFILQNNIKVLILENFDFSFKLPSCDSIIITAQSSKKLFGFKQLTLMPLDFEEFLLHDNRHQNTTNSFNYFLKYGNLPEIINYDEHKKLKRLQEILELYCQDKTQIEILKLLIISIDEKKSINQLFTTLKKSQKISKDKFYETCKAFEANKTIFFIEKYQQSKAVKKVYIYNHAFLTATSHIKKFKNEFANLIFLELVKSHEKIYYHDYIDFYIPQTKTALLALPFFNNLVMNSLKRKLFNTLDELKVKHLYIITIGNSESFFYENIKIDVVPFYEWALLN